MAQENLHNERRKRSGNRIGPISKHGFVWWGETRVTPEAYAEARELMRNSRAIEMDNSEHLAHRERGRQKLISPSASHLADPKEEMSAAAQARKTDDDWYLAEEIASKMKLHITTVRAYCRAGLRVVEGAAIEGPYIIGARCGTTWRISETEFLKFIGRLEGRDVQHRKRAGGAQK